MANAVNNILSLNLEEVVNFLVKSEPFRRFELQEHSCLGEILKLIRDTLCNMLYGVNLENKITIDAFHNVNLDILMSKEREVLQHCSVPFILLSYK